MNCHCSKKQTSSSDKRGGNKCRCGGGGGGGANSKKCNCRLDKDSCKCGGAAKGPSKAVVEKCKGLVLSDEQIRWVMENFLAETETGLKKATRDRSTIKNYITYVQDLPDGTEHGEYVALDVGGTNLRVLLVELRQPHNCNIRTKIFSVPQEVKRSGIELFDFIASCLADFLKQVSAASKALPLGFTFSFPTEQNSLKEGISMGGSKDFNFAEIIGKDVMRLLEEAISRRGDVTVDACAVVNDTAGTLMSCAWEHHNCKIGVVVGTGTNACYLERQSKCDFFNDKDYGSGTVIVNTEWGALGDDGRLEHLRTDYDREVDSQCTVNPGIQVHEKMISGLYISELVRVIFKHLIEEKVILGGRGAEHFAEKHLFDAGIISEIESDLPGKHEKCRGVLEELGVVHATDQDCTDIRYICECVSRRSAHLVAAMIAALIHKIDDPDVTVGVDGSLYKYHPHYHNLLVKKIGELVKPGFKFLVAPSEDGGGRGAALIAAVYFRCMATKQEKK